MAKLPQKPLLNPILRLTKDPKPESINGGGKDVEGIKKDRLDAQRVALSQQFSDLHSNLDKQTSFNGRVIIYAEMFEDSLAPTWTPSDLFHSTNGAQLIVPYKTGYLIELETNQLNSYASLVDNTSRIKESVDISRVQSVSFFNEENVIGRRSLTELWDSAPEEKNGRTFLIWLMPFKDNGAVSHLSQKIQMLQETKVIRPLPHLLASSGADFVDDVPTTKDDNRLNIVIKEYQQKHRARTTIIVPSYIKLQELVDSKTIFRIVPAPNITATIAPGMGAEPERPLSPDINNLPIVGVVDGGLSANSYIPAVAWRATPLVDDYHADIVHGNQVTSLIVQGHEWNNKLMLPPLTCRVGVAQAVPRNDRNLLSNIDDLLIYLDKVITANQNTKVWNLSFNVKEPCDPDFVSPLGHDLSQLARNHKVLLINSIGNKPGILLQPPADCEAALTVGGRIHDSNGMPANACPVCLSGPGPSSMLKPELSNFSNVRVIGGDINSGSSFATALTSPLAAHTIAQLRDPSPDLVKALLINNADGNHFDPALGFGTPNATNLPWQCRPGFVTLQWKASLRPGAAYYWELPIPPSLRKTGKLKGTATLTAILNPHPLASDYAGPNYFGVRLETALQYQQQNKKSGKIGTKNLLGSLDTGRVTEQEARRIDYKWSPIRHHKKSFQNTGFYGDNLRIYARLYTRDLYYHDLKPEDIPEMEVFFVLSIGTGEEADDVYNELRNQLGTDVEVATIETNIEIDNDGE